MPKVSKKSAAEVDDGGVLVDRHEEIEGYTVDFFHYRQGVDESPLMQGLPGDSCPCPHWGYVLKGRMRYRFADHEEICEQGDAFYVGPGHVPVSDDDTEILVFSPTEEFLRVKEHATKKLQQMSGA
ncbi:hypothetical protein [Nocardia transvalensis]|uniref:hypothetical protein n=1 Tax=Nocardia transvalensis TaxID=37333 RepID=UPI00189636B4|nr:hypothetical protein [Nocardia transvalensis]MBF6327917.1 hypothetical protein [Nocardia transvalensis]